MQIKSFILLLLKPNNPPFPGELLMWNFCRKYDEKISKVESTGINKQW